MNKIAKFLPFLAWIGEIRDSNILKADLVAGLTVALVLVPQSMAYAQLAGLPPQHGLYASFLPVMIAALMGSSRQLGTGPVAVVSLLTAAAVPTILPEGASMEEYVVYASLLAFLVGIFQFALGALKLGFVINFLSHPVVVGFTNAAAIIIGTSQLNKIFGVVKGEGDHTYEQVWGTIANATSDTNMITLTIALIAFAIMIAVKKYAPKLPGVLLAVAVTTIIAWLIDFGGSVETGGYGGAIVGVIPEGLPPLVIPGFDFSVMNQMIVTAITIGLIGFMEAISIAKAMAAQTKQRLDANQELMGQGLSNVVSSFFQGYAVSGSFSRSAVNISAGAVTGFSSVVTAVIVGITLLFLTPLLYHLPQATLAAVIIMAVINLIKFAPIMHAWKVEKHDAIVAVTSFVLTLIFAPHLENGIVIGVILSLALFLYRTMQPRFTELSAHSGSTMLVNALDNKLDRCEVVSIVKYSGSLYFGNAGYFEDRMLNLIAEKHQCLKYIIVDMAGINQIDASGEEMLAGLLDRCSAAGVEILFARTEGIEKVLRKSGFMDQFGEDRFYDRRTDALRHAWKELGDDEAASHSPLKHLIS
ncbi:MAG: sulfate permease [Candidatus Thioglobus sp.]|uniref:SulP family inorganic anion transporter n=1 Tax=Candidatus Thioglobus sp. TaxID=2026721 RepID=UPI0025C46258|nr:sulfate permease [Candidatus Thioglobus sp.]MBT3277585.1 sulfate permease [Candidatus Thioglobus sp.]MBT3744291.1 sulfate permease [Candidatus Thioglobus sp.]MBT6359943.1 sulfate permease [Candidatus Thioglobus sp.]MBT6966139.1 sulfate permease [Candidatus Thioglobus sp.]MBT7295121.1 sulfate permease [Candidatus Thioglobus sp.]